MSTIRMFLTLLAILLVGGPSFSGAAIGPGAGPVTMGHGGMEGCCGDPGPAPVCDMAGANCGAVCMIFSSVRNSVAEYKTVLAGAPLVVTPRSYLPAPETAPPKSRSV